MKILMFLLLMAFGVRFQIEKWYFAWKDQTAIAFTASGQVRELGHFDAESAGGFRLSEASALAALYKGYDIQALAYLTPNGMTMLQGRVDLDLLGIQGFSLPTYNLPYVIIRPNACLFQWCQYSRPLWVANIEAGTVEVIAQHTLTYTPQSLGLDGHFLRYARRERGDDVHWTIQERDLQTGEEREFYNFVSPMGSEWPWPISVYADPSGAYWLHSEPTVITAGDHPEFWRRLIGSDGSIEILDHIPEGDIPRYTWSLVGANILRQEIDCTRACRLDFRAVNSFEWESFPISDNGHFDFVRPLGDGRALAWQYNSLAWILREFGPPLRLGNAGYQDWISPDNTWLLTLTDSEHPSTYRVWNLKTEQVALEGDVPAGIDIHFFDGGFLINQYSLGEGRTILASTNQKQDIPVPALLYRYRDGKTFALDDLNYFDVLPDGSLLESRYDGGIYRIDPESGAETLLVPDAVVVRLG